LYLVLIALLAIAGIGLYALTSHDGGNSGKPAVNDTVNETARNVTAPKVEENNPWEISGPGPVWQLHTAEDGTLYSFQGEHGNTIRAISPNGSIEWEYQVPDEWRVTNTMYRRVEIKGLSNMGLDFINPVFSLDNGTLYLYLRENKITDVNHYPDEEHPVVEYYGYRLNESLMAIKDGRLLWEMPISSEHHSFEDSNVYAQNGRVYVFDDYSVTVFGDNGSKLFRIDNASSPPAVDEGGNIYIVPGVPPADQTARHWIGAHQNIEYKEPASIVQAFSPDGVLMWQNDAGSRIVRPAVTEDLTRRFDTLPLYDNHTLYAPTRNGIIALSTDGNVKWSKKYNHSIDLLPFLPFDDNGNVYVMDSIGSSYNDVHAIFPDGSERNIPQGYDGIYGDATDGMVYDLLEGYRFPPVFPENNSLPVILSGKYLTAYSQREGVMLWKHQMQYNWTDIIIGSDIAQKVRGASLDTYIDYNYTESISALIIRTVSDTLYVYDFEAIYEPPLVINKSHFNYSSVISAFDKADGRLLCQKPLDVLVTSMVVNNDTLYYGTRDGNVSGGITRDRSELPPPVLVTVTGDVGKVVGTVAGGAAVTAAVVLFLKMFAFGGLTRAKGQLNTNDNRNKTLEFVVKHPGSTQYEIAHGLGMNVGTIRYHLFILSMNHRITSFKSDGKFVRYFTNSGSYSKDEQFILSLVRRDPVRKILNLLLEKAEISNLEISEALDMHDSATSRYLKELAARGVVAKRSLAGGRTSYSLCREFREPVAMAIERISGD